MLAIGRMWLIIHSWVRSHEVVEPRVLKLWLHYLPRAQIAGR
jgi:hypothetical protein